MGGAHREHHVRKPAAKDAVINELLALVMS
jgi:hypothetical protein